MQTNKTGVTHRTHIEKAYVTIWSYRSTWRSCPCTSSLVSADEHFNTIESSYQLEETARSSQENMDLSDSGWYWNVIARLLDASIRRGHGRGTLHLWRLRTDDDELTMCCLEIWLKCVILLKILPENFCWKLELTLVVNVALQFDITSPSDSVHSRNQRVSLTSPVITYISNNRSTQLN